MIASELEAALRQDLRDEATWTVYADWLGSQGDSRGELIGYEQRAEAERDRELAAQWQRRAKLLFERDHERWLGPLRKANIRATWMRGFVTEALVHDRPRWTAETLLGSRTGALLYRMGFTRLPDVQPVAEALADSWIDVVELRKLDTNQIAPLAALRGLRELFIDECELVDLAALRELPMLERIVIHKSQIDLRAFWRGFAALRHLVISHHFHGSISIHEGVDIGGLARLTNLEILDLRGSRVVDLSPLVGLGKLRQLDISRTAVRSLSPLERLPALERIDAIDMRRRYLDFTRLIARGVYVERQPTDRRVRP